MEDRGPLEFCSFRSVKAMRFRVIRLPIAARASGRASASSGERWQMMYGNVPIGATKMLPQKRRGWIKARSVIDPENLFHLSELEEGLFYS